MKETIKNLKKVYSFGKEYKKNLLVFSILSLAFIAVDVIYPIYTAKKLTNLTSGIYEQLICAAIVVLFFDILKAIKMVAKKKNNQIFFRGTFKNLQLAISREILKIKAKDLDSNSSGVFIERLNNDCNELAHIFTSGIELFTGTITNIAVFVSIFIISKWVFLFYLLSALLVTYLYIIKVKKVDTKDKAYRKQREKNTGLTGELVRGVRDIKLLNAKESFMMEIERGINELTNKTYDKRNMAVMFDFIISIVLAVLEVILIILLIYLISQENITIAIAVVLYSYKSNIMVNLMSQLGALLEKIKTFNLSCERVFSLLDGDEFSKEKFGDIHLDKINGDFSFKNVTFGYGDENIVLKDISFKVSANETVGFVGKSGSGKTTIFNLLCKMYDIKKGEITIDGININKLDESSIRGNITIISQNPYIFNMSIKDNLKLVKEDLTDEEMKEACKLACLDDYIEVLPDKYDTIVGEAGVILSGGQKQRLAIARALIQKTEIILFDEATSALDNDTQFKIQQAIDNLKNDYTILIIAHRLSTIIKCDRIYFLESGKVLDSGSHFELLKRCDEYKKLYELEIQNN